MTSLSEEHKNGKYDETWRMRPATRLLLSLSSIILVSKSAKSRLGNKMFGFNPLYLSDASCQKSIII